MAPRPHAGAPPAHPVEPLHPGLLLLVLALLALQHLRAHLGEASLEHLLNLASYLEAALGATAWEPPAVYRGGGASGGGLLYYWLHYPLAALGLSPASIQVLHLALEAAALLGWLYLARGLLPASLIWSAAFWLALYGPPKAHLAENSTFLAFASVFLFVTFLRALARGRWSAILWPALVLALATHLSALAVLVLPALLLGCLALPRPHAWRAALLLTAAAAATLAPALLQAAAHPGQNIAGDMLAWMQPGQAAQAARAALAHLARLLADPPLAAGILAAVLARGSIRALAFPRLTFAWLLLVLGATVLLTLDNQCEPYYFGMASPARALVAGLALHWLLTRAAPRLSPRLTWQRGLGGLLAVACLVTAVQALAAARRPPPPPALHCAAVDAPCPPRQAGAVLDLLDASGLTPGPTARVRFHGSLRTCLQGAWAWRRLGLGRAAAPSGAETRILTLPRKAGQRLPPYPGAVAVGELVFVPGVREARYQEAFGQGDIDFGVWAGAARRLYISYESGGGRPEGPVPTRGRHPKIGQWTVAATCSHDHPGLMLGHDGHLILQREPGPPDPSFQPMGPYFRLNFSGQILEVLALPRESGP